MEEWPSAQVFRRIGSSEVLQTGDRGGLCLWLANCYLRCLLPLRSTRLLRGSHERTTGLY
jgi:hypothetical protein